MRLPLLHLLALLTACAETAPSECTVRSGVSGFSPDCDSAELIRYTGESRLFLPGVNGGLLTAWLPEALEAITYGGTSGQPLILMLELENGSTLAPAERSTSLTIASLDDDRADVRIDARFDTGDITGPLQVLMTDQ